MSSKDTPVFVHRHANVDLNSRTTQEGIPSSLPQRPKNFNTYGKETTIMLSTFNVTNSPTIMVHQYDVSARRASTRMARRQPSCLTPSTSPSLQLSEQQSILVMCHTRELAYQIRNEYNRFAKFLPDVRVGVF